jgi:redox-sensitive bicupin YhaK (pirin superfamily)
MAGEITLNGTPVSKHAFVVFRNAGERLHVAAGADAQILLLSGEPIDEPVVQHGPFVMNTRAEIAQAFQDLEGGKFGYLAD